MMTNDPTSWTEAELWAEIHRLRAELKGPDGFDTWKDAALHERLLRVNLIESLDDLVKRGRS